jgi:hypothetical protein
MHQNVAIAAKNIIENYAAIYDLPSPEKEEVLIITRSLIFLPAKTN